ncbi:C40 family peptidase [Sutcliffiella rhizosphaerae]|uniref:Permuted papain-like amidase YaeF/Yiix C92 family enzyme n=1 Tax=Sutcliffiella rhizosphaerae TaxID=2880967 RepID=A0ABM8YK50_9BACI|nr:hypothetical protein [Sutcliffiella rhizosphaerae]CAG9620299.1 hypothetical protein BACCIP111883_01067 [Sutcliffiella rhizosphaerae]
MKTSTYQSLLPHLKTGDLVLFSGKYSISKLVEKLEHSMWSHVGMVVRPDPAGEVYFFESTALTNLEDVYFHDHKTGPKVVKLIDRLNTYGKDLDPYEPPQYALRSINLEGENIDEEQLFVYMQKVHGIPNPSQWKMIEEVIEGRFFHITSQSNDYTCSKLIAETYQTLGLFFPDMPLNGYMPADFSSPGRVKLTGAKLGEEVLIELEQGDVSITSESSSAPFKVRD